MTKRRNKSGPGDHKGETRRTGRNKAPPARGPGAPVDDVRPCGVTAEMRDPDAPIKRRGSQDLPEAPLEP
jgi:hypothetical protein